MNFSKCARCGCFYTSSDSVCPNCAPKDSFEISKLENYLTENKGTTSLTDICLGTGITVKNLNRYFENEKFSGTFENKPENKGNMGINL